MTTLQHTYNIDTRHLTNAMELARLARVVRTLVAMGRRKAQALIDIQVAFGLTAGDIQAIIRLV